jgi:LAO/AO transport system kinase
VTGAAVRGRDLLARGIQGDVAATSQLITAVEARNEVGLAGLDQVYAKTGRAHVVGITGTPGSGKSTLVAAMAREWRARDRTVAIVAVDPSSSLSGGAILGDRIRMVEHATDPGIFIRSMSSRGVLGGLSRATVDVVAVLDATNWDIVVIETVGVGQAEIDIVQIAESTVVVSVPGLGDGIQAIKAGLLEVADIHVVNKADRADANRTMKELRNMLALGVADTAVDAWVPPLLATSATTGVGVAELVSALTHHREWLASSGSEDRRRHDNASARVRAIAKELILAQLHGHHLDVEFEEIISRVAARQMSPYAAAANLVSRIVPTAEPIEGADT